MLFDTFDATDLNKELKGLMDGLSVKVGGLGVTLVLQGGAAVGAGCPSRWGGWGLVLQGGGADRGGGGRAVRQGGGFWVWWVGD